MNMNKYTTNTVLDANPSETPLFSQYFDWKIDTIMNNKRYKSLAAHDTLYLLLPDYERVQVRGFLVDRVMIEKMDAPGWHTTEPADVHQLVKPHVRRDGGFELRRVEVEGSYTPSSRDNVSWWETDKVFEDEYLSRPLKRVSVGDLVFVLPNFVRYWVLSRSENGLGLNLVPYGMSGTMHVLVAKFEDVRVLQSFVRAGEVAKVLLLPDFRVVNHFKSP